ncbi:MAG: hypothetical protein M1830_000183 [Pleopsidium flavum]|nr:MAG: hypothetical protein M1830_000183 [Pleopsidium flavum]
MKTFRLRQRCPCGPFTTAFSSSLLLLSLFLPAPSFSQLTSSEGPTSTLSAPAQSTTTNPVSSTLSTLTTPKNLTSTSTTPSSTTTTTTTNPNSTPDDLPSNSIVNYYFLLIALSIIIILAVLWSIHRRKKKNSARSRNSGHNALERDLEGWMGTRRWGTGGWRGGGGPRGEEGLDERGEAPPPYVPPEPRPTHDGLVGVDERVDGGHSTAGLSIPLRTLSRDERKPPDYRET